MPHARGTVAPIDFSIPANGSTRAREHGDTFEIQERAHSIRPPVARRSGAGRGDLRRAPAHGLACLA